jgi:hypothetical protein
MTTAQPSTVWANVNTSKQVGDPADMDRAKGLVGAPGLEPETDN